MMISVAAVQAKLKGGTIAEMIIAALLLAPGADLAFLQEVLRPAHPDAVEREVRSLLASAHLHDLGGHLFALGDTKGMAEFVRLKLPEQRVGWRHTKMQRLYRELGRAELQSSGGPISEGMRLVIYQGQDNRMWARPEPEFEDGRFEVLGGP